MSGENRHIFYTPAHCTSYSSTTDYQCNFQDQRFWKLALYTCVPPRINTFSILSDNGAVLSCSIAVCSDLDTI